ncbi:hypothetical protein L195_g032634, partial [Trifolium pratense]
RERNTNAAPRASVERRRRSPPSPEVRHKRGGPSVDSGEWIEVSRRKRRASRQDVDRQFRSRSVFRNHHDRSILQSRNRVHHDRIASPNPDARRSSPAGRSKSRFNRERDCSARRLGVGSDHRHVPTAVNRRLCFNLAGDRRLQRDEGKCNDWNAMQVQNDNEREERSNERFDKQVLVRQEVDGRRLMQESTCVIRKEKEMVVDGGRGKLGDGGNSNVVFKRYVSFYFTNFPPLIPNFFLRKGFEVCGMLEDVFVAKKTNRYGEPYGFVKFSNVKDVSKLTKALNAVCFGQYRVKASVALFNRYNAEAVSRTDKEKDVKMTGAVKPMNKEGLK